MNRLRRPSSALLANPAVRLNVLAPAVTYWLLSRHGVSALNALALAAVFPALAAGWTIARTRRLDPLALVSLATITSGLAAGLVFHSGRIILVKEAFAVGAVGVVFLGSVPTRRPLVFLVRRRLLTRQGPAAVADYERGWQRPHVRSEARRATAILGVTLLAEAGLHVALSYALSPQALLIAAPLLGVLMIGPVAVWTLRDRDRDRAAHPSVAEPVGAALKTLRENADGTA